MNTTHSVVGELIGADFDVHNSLPTITLQLRQRCNGYSQQHITAMRSYPGTLAAARLARDHYMALRTGALYRVAADGIGVSPSTGVVYLLGVRDAQEVGAQPMPYPARAAAALALDAEPNSLAAEGACRGLAMSLPLLLQAAGAAL
jgi:hypothetical protein